MTIESLIKSAVDGSLKDNVNSYPLEDESFLEMLIDFFPDYNTLDVCWDYLGQKELKQWIDAQQLEDIKDNLYFDKIINHPEMTIGILNIIPSYFRSVDWTCRHNELYLSTRITP